MRYYSAQSSRDLSEDMRKTDTAHANVSCSESTSHRFRTQPMPSPLPCHECLLKTFRLIPQVVSSVIITLQVYSEPAGYLEIASFFHIRPQRCTERTRSPHVSIASARPQCSLEQDWNLGRTWRRWLGRSRLRERGHTGRHEPPSVGIADLRARRGGRSESCRQGGRRLRKE